VRKRPRSLTVVGWLFIAAGTIGLAYHASELNTQSTIETDAIWVLLMRLLAIVAGVFMLRGANWARWLALAWLAYHVILSAFHSWSETFAHAVLFAMVAYALLRPDVFAYFRGRERAS
jgi:hypothetical protein